MVITILYFDPWDQFQGLNIGQKVITPKFTKMIKVMSDLNSWVSSLLKDTLFFQIGPLVQKIYSYFEIGLKPAVVSCLTNALVPPTIVL